MRPTEETVRYRLDRKTRFAAIGEACSSCPPKWLAYFSRNVRSRGADVLHLEVAHATELPPFCRAIRPDMKRLQRSERNSHRTGQQ
jgi:hypothetical protein